MKQVAVTVLLLIFSAHAFGAPAPLIRGTLWWVLYEEYQPWSNAELASAIDAQCAVGFDVLWLLNTPQLVAKAIENEKAGTPGDLLERIMGLADERGMHVIVDLPVGGWYGKTTPGDMEAAIRAHVDAVLGRYGHHASLWGWYLNHEINPIASDDAVQSAYWREVWKEVAAYCHQRAPKSMVTISPFFLLDEARKRGFVYLTPAEYGAWWEQTVRETGIDLVMLQDSGEHLSFFTIEQREPFWHAVVAACHRAGAQCWLNVESGEAEAPDWDTFLTLSAEKWVTWRFTPMDWLARKLERAAACADGIINWGYFPYMDPLPPSGKKTNGSLEAYAAYKAYYEAKKLTGITLPPLPTRQPS